MLVELAIRDFALIDQLRVALAPGFNVLTGETGAGKSIIVGALGLLLGERASSDLVRAGAARAVVEGTFDIEGRADAVAALDAHGLDADDGTVVLRREVAAAGRARAWVNGTAVTATVLAEVGRRLVDLHGQHEAQTLLDEASQRAILDAFAGAQPEAGAMRDAHTALLEARQGRAALLARRAEAEKRADWLRHVVREIDDVSPVPGEDVALEDEARRLEHADELRSLAQQAAAALDGDDASALPLLGALRRPLAHLTKLDPSQAGRLEALESALIAVQELAGDLAGYADQVELDPERLHRVQQRRDRLHALVRKYGPSLDDVLRARDEARGELDLLGSAEFDLRSLAERERQAESAVRDAASALTAKRRAAADRLADAVSGVLPRLGMADGRFAVALVPREAPGADGAEGVEFRVQLNVGHDERPLARVASGGELARVMLALKTVLARVDRIPTLVFDEVDAGIGGRVGLQVGDAMRGLATTHQVFAITHLPQIAARAHHHLLVAKAPRDGMTTTDVTVLADAARVAEVARMLGGDPESDVSRAHARELLAAVPADGDAAASGDRTASSTAAAPTRPARRGGGSSRSSSRGGGS